MKKTRWTGKEIKALRDRLALTQAAFGVRLGVSGNYVWMMEADQKVPSPSLRLLLDCIDRDTKGAK